MIGVAMTEVLIGLACLAGSVVSGELLRRFGLAVLAGMPAEFQDRLEVQHRYATLNEHTPLGPQFVSLVRAGWTLVFMAIFAVVAAADFDLAVLLLAAAVAALVWAVRDFDDRRRDEARFQESIGVEYRSLSRSERGRMNGIYRALHMAGWLGWLVGAALVGSGIGSAIG
jgi:nitrogen fixation-related uncharacterized protein